MTTAAGKVLNALDIDVTASPSSSSQAWKGKEILEKEYREKEYREKKYREKEYHEKESFPECEYI